MISVVCAFNDRQSLERWLLPSLQRQTAKHELHLVDNTGNQFPSAARALNHGAEKARGDYIMFIHQDVSLATADWLEKVEAMVGSLPSLGVAGVAGKAERGPHSLSNLEQGDPPRYACAEPVSEPVKVQTLDECLALVPRQVFERHKFNEDLCPDWHLYVIEYCLRLGREGLKAYVLPERAYHRSDGRIQFRYPDAYYATLARLLPAFRDEHDYIVTTCDDYSTRVPVRLQRSWLWRAGRRTKKMVLWPFTADRRLARICGYLMRTDAGRAVTRKLVLPANTEEVLAMARKNHYDLLRAELRPADQFGNDLLTASDINEHLATLRMTTQAMNLKNVLELGVGDGMSTLALLQAANEIGGKVTSIDEGDCVAAKRRVEDAGLSGIWTFIEGNDLLVDWSGPIDHLFINTLPTYDRTYAELAKFEPFVAPGGLITLHGTLSFEGIRLAISDYLVNRPDLISHSFFHNNGLAVISKKKARGS